MNNFITIIGNVAAGKTTMAEFLAKTLPGYLESADDLYKTNPFFNESVTDLSRWSLASDVWFLIKRLEMAKELETVLKDQPVVQDSGLLMSWVYANSRVGLQNRSVEQTGIYNNLYATLTSTLPKESLVIYLSLPITVLQQRIFDRRRDFEIKFHTDSYLTTIEDTLHQLVAKLEEHNIRVLSFNEQNWCDIVNGTEGQEKLLSLVRQAL
jgi:deoxyadenosine/deoxycytidine kinase